MKLSVKLNRYYLEIIFLIIIGLIPLLWYKDGYLVLGHDVGFPLSPVDHFKDKLYIWTDRMGPFASGQIQVLAGLFIHGIEAALSLLGLSLVTVQKITFIFWFTLPGITMYILLRFLHPEKEDYPIRLSGSLFYMMNHYLLEAWTIAERTKFSIIAAIPIVILLIIKAISRKESALKNSLLLALTMFILNGGGGVPLWGGLSIAALSTILILFILTKENFIPKIKRTLSFLFLSLVFLMLLNAYWLIPLLNYDQSFNQWVESGWGTAGAIAWSQVISVHTSWIELFKLRGIPEWYDNLEHPYANEFFSNYLLIALNLFFSSIALVGLLKINDKKKDLFSVRICFLLMLLIAIPLAAGSHLPLGGVYDWALGNIPGFIIFRSSFFKFGMIIWFVYAYFIALGLKLISDWIKEKIKDNPKCSLITPTVFGLFVIGTLIYNYPYLNGIFFHYSKNHSTMVKVPDYVFEAKRELDNHKFSARTLYIPSADLRTKYMEYDWGFFSLEVLQHLLGRNSTVINGVLAQPNETDLLNAIYLQYSLFGTSDLVKYTGIDRAVLQNDFVSPDYMENPITDIKEVFKSSADFKFSKNIGKWDFHNYTKNVLPLIYSPKRIAFVSSTGSSLHLATRLPGDRADYDTFFWLESNKQNHSFNNTPFSRYVVEAVCADCQVSESYPIYGAPSKILIPGGKIYEINRLLGNIRKLFTINTDAKIDFILTNSSVVVGNLGSLAQNKNEARAVKIAAEDLIRDLEEVRSNIEKISDPKLKEENLKKARFIYNHFVSVISQWEYSAQSDPITSDLIALEGKLRDYLLDIEMEIPSKEKIDVDKTKYKYKLNIPIDGRYNFYLYSPSLLKGWDNIIVDSQIINIQKINQDWYGVLDIPLKKSSINLEVPKAVLSSLETVKVPDFKLLAEPNNSSCKEIRLNDYLQKSGKRLDPAVNYKIIFKHNLEIARLNLQILDVNKKLSLDDVIRGVYPTTVENKQTGAFETTVDYIPSLSADDLLIKLCLNPLQGSSYADISSFLIYSFPAKPVIFASLDNDLSLASSAIEYVALNQTKYLIKINDQKEQFILNFNSRFDKSWTIRELDPILAQIYFQGDKKLFLDGNVTEYQRGDRHIISDILFPGNWTNSFPPSFMLNGFSNSWVISPTPGIVKERVFLLEYRDQNNFYKAAGISIASLIVVCILYFIKYGRFKSGENN